MLRILFHLDMDAFYAAVEQRDNPKLRGQPVIVGSPPNQRGVVCAASYEARKFGVRSAMPSATAGRLCPKGIFVPPRMTHYREESKLIMALLEQTGAVIEPMSIDEAYMDLSEIFQRQPGGGVRPSPGAATFGFPPAPNSLETLRSLELAATGDGRTPPAEVDAALFAAVPIARELKNKIFSQRGLTASIGIASNKLLAKLASDFQKPNGLTLVPERDKVPFLRPMPVRAIHGVGKVTEQVLQQAGVETIGDLQDYPGDLRALVGSFGPKLKQFSFGEDDRPLEIGDDIKSISSEETFLRDTEDRKILRACLREQAAEISAKLKRKHLGARTVQVKVRYGDFSTLTRQISVEEPITEPGDLYRLGCFLLGKERLVSHPLRLLGLGASALAEPTNQQWLFR